MEEAVEKYQPDDMIWYLKVKPLFILYVLAVYIYCSDLHLPKS